MIGPAKLYVKSTKVPITAYVSQDIPGHYCQDGYRTQSMITRLAPEDAKAKDILAKSGIRFELVDLSAGRGGKRFTAWFRGVRRTPTLRVEGDRKKYEGIMSILEYASALRS